MTQMKIPISVGDRLRARKGSAQHCLIATAARRQWGGEWTATPGVVERDTGNGQVMRWRPSLGAYLTMFLFDAGLPVPVRSVKLVRGRKVTSRRRVVQSPGRKPRMQCEPPPAARPARPRRAQGMAAGVALAGAVLVAAEGLEWVAFAIAGVLAAVAAVVTAVKVRHHRRAGVLAPAPVAPSRSSWAPGTRRAMTATVAGTAGAPEPPPARSLTRPRRQAPEPGQVQAAAPKAAPVIRELPAQALPASQEVVNASS